MKTRSDDIHMQPPSRFVCLLAWIFLAVIPASANALDSDSQMPITVTADKADIDNNRDISIYTGNVIVTQGSILITCDTLRLYSGKTAVDKLVAQGNPATYKQRPEGKKENIHAQGNRIEYFANTDTAVFIDNAILRQGNNTFKSKRITYNISADKVNAGNVDGSERVTITIHPKTGQTEQKSPRPEQQDKKPSAAQPSR